MSTKKKKSHTKLKKLLKMGLGGAVFFAAGFILVYVILLFSTTQTIETASIEGQKIENTPFYITNIDELNDKLSTLTFDRTENIMYAEPLNVEEVQMLGIEVQENMKEFTDFINNYNRNHIEDETKEDVEEYYQVIRNLRQLRELDRDIFYELYFIGVDYTHFYDIPKELTSRDGKLVLQYDEPIDPRMYKYYTALTKTEIFELLIEPINEMFYFERDLPIIFSECGQVNAYYKRDDQTITMCYELLDYFYNVSKTVELNSINKTEEFVVDGTFFTLMHELGHVFIDIFDLQFIGQEEDVADHFSMILATELFGYDSAKIVELLFNGPRFDIHLIAGGNSWSEEELSEMSEEQRLDVERDVYADAHSLDRQRVLDALCLIYGINPLKAEFFITDFEEKYVLTQETLNNCPEIYLDTSNFWYNALFPYLRRKDLDN